MNKLVEKVAIAICPWFNGSKDERPAQAVWDDMFERYKAAYRQQAEAAIEAISLEHWQPIATAPKDGTRILVFEDGAMEVAEWYTHNYPPKYVERQDGLYDKQEQECSSWWNANECQHPTHWMPLPEQPSRESGDKS